MTAAVTAGEPSAPPDAGMIDAYAHVGLPRFQSPDDCLAVMGAAGIAKALICPFQSCPDLEAVHLALRTWPTRFRGLGIPLGADRDEMSAGVRAQLAAGFVGLRLSGADVRDRPWLLDLLGEAAALALICGRDGLAEGAPALVDYLERYDDGLVIGGHCAGPTDPSLLEGRSASAELFGHDRFAVVASCHGLFEPGLITDWMTAVIERVGWARLLWGSEAPVLYWRDESIGSASRWVDRFEPDASQRQAFVSANAARLIFGRPVAAPGALELPFDPWDHVVASPAPTWPHGLALDTTLTGRLVHGWLRWGGAERGLLRDYLADVLDHALPPVAS